MTAQQLRPDSLKALGVNVTPEIDKAYENEEQQGDEWIKLATSTGLTREMVERWKWEAFWDAPLYIEGSGVRPPTHATSIPPMNGLFGQPGLPRKPEEVKRVTASYKATSCEVKSNGNRLEITFPNATAGVFAGRLQYDVYKGTNLIRQALIAKTDEPSVAFKYDGGLKGLAIAQGSKVIWKDLAGRWQDQQFGGPVSQGPATVWSQNRLILAEVPGGSIAAFPPPHIFYWARESEQNLGYSWCRKDSATTFSFGTQQAEKEEDPEFLHNYALYSARPGTWQQMRVFLYVSPEPAQTAAASAMAFTNNDRFKPLPGYQVMGHHYHVGLVERLKELGGLDARINDTESIKAAGINIFGIIDGARGASAQNREQHLEALAEYYEAARRQSDKTFLVMPNKENLGVNLGGHSDLLVSKPTMYVPRRAAGQALVEQHPKFGKVYNLGSPADVMEMTKLENAIISMPHPRSKGSTGYPDSVKEAAHFLHEGYHGAGFRWGMGVDASETRLCEYRCMALLDEMANWYVDRPMPLKQMLAISEARSDIGHRGKPTYDDTYGQSPVSYVKLDRLPTVDDMSALMNALKRGDYVVTSGEVLISSWSVEGSGNQRTVVADVEWTFPLDFVEVVWGDGQKVDRQVISAADLAPFGKKRFSIPLNAAGKKWVRFAAYDVAANGAFVNPVRLSATTTTTSASAGR
jgi:hypothetical protein